MPSEVIGWVFHATWVSALVGYLLWKDGRERQRRIAKMEARNRADEERHQRRMAEWDEESRKRDEEQAERDRVWAEREAEMERLLAEVEALEAQVGPAPSPAP